jgi:hypothetical protein
VRVCHICLARRCGDGMCGPQCCQYVLLSNRYPSLARAATHSYGTAISAGCVQGVQQLHDKWAAPAHHVGPEPSAAVWGGWPAWRSTARARTKPADARRDAGPAPAPAPAHDAVPGPPGRRAAPAARYEGN